jgi:uncharacterized protein (TIGR02271 family)
MIHKQEFLQQHPQFHTGVELFSEDGEKLGKITDMEDDQVIVSRGTFFAREFSCRYDDIAEADQDRAVLGHRRDDLAPWSDENYPGWEEYDRINRGEQEHTEGEGESRMQLSEEELQAQKHERSEQARVRKVVHTEMRNITVPVTKEKLVVERTPVNEAREARPDEKPFEEQDMTVQLREEEVEVSKRPVVKEEVRVSKKAQTEQQKVSEQVRKEELEVDQR